MHSDLQEVVNADLFFGRRVTRPLKGPTLEFRQAGEDVLVYDPVHDKIHVLNSTAGHVLRLCDGTRSSLEIAQMLSTATGTDSTVVERDVDMIINQFATLKLIPSDED